MRTRIVGAAAAAIVVIFSVGAPEHRLAASAGATVPTALQLADHGLQTVVGPDDEGTYQLIDPIGPGGVASVDAAEEVYSPTLDGGKYQPWAGYRDPFAPAPNGPPTTAPYPPGGAKPYSGGGGGR